MRRMPDERRLSRLLDTPEAGECVRAVARAVAAFHARAETSPEISRAGTREVVEGNWRANFEQCAPYVGPVLDPRAHARVRALAAEYLAGREPLLAQRIESGMIRDGHGDLLADDIFCPPDGPRILDCLAFDDALRHGDVLLDVGFLAMDLERLGHPRLAERLLRWYQEFDFERHPVSLAHHYVAYRAHLRAKIACLRVDQGDTAAAEEARALLALSLDHLECAQVRLVLVGGPPGTGKSTLAGALARRTGAMLLSSDAVRKELAGIGLDESGRAPLDAGLYAPERVADVYRELLVRAERLLGLGESVIVDASWGAGEARAHAREVGARAHAPVRALWCRAPAGLVRDRVSARERARRGNVSDAGADVAERLAERFADWPEAEVIDTARPLAHGLEDALRAVGPRSALPG
jgi:predicted kinase